MACLKRLNKKHLLDLLLAAFEAGLGRASQPAASNDSCGSTPEVGTPHVPLVASSSSGPATRQNFSIASTALGATLLDAGQPRYYVTNAAMAAGPGIWGFPFDLPAASPEQAATTEPVGRLRHPARRSSARGVVGVREGAVAHLQKALEIVLAEWAAIQ